MLTYFAGFMFCTYFVSWWLNNTASTAMMLPVVQAVIESFADHAEQDKELQVVNSEYPITVDN